MADTDEIEKDNHRERNRNHAATVALEHWRSLLQQIRAGQDLASEHRSRFFAGTERSLARLAREFYSEAHLAKLVALSQKEVIDRMSPWLELGIDSVLEWEDDPSEQERKLGCLATSQYVITVEHHHLFGGTPSVDRHPNEDAVYTDLYERTASGYSVGGIIHLAKTTGEPFTSQDMRATFRGMAKEFYENAADDGEKGVWDFQWVGAQNEDRVLVVRVDEKPKTVRGGLPPEATE